MSVRRPEPTGRLVTGEKLPRPRPARRLADVLRAGQPTGITLTPDQQRQWRESLARRWAQFTRQQRREWQTFSQEDRLRWLEADKEQWLAQPQQPQQPAPQAPMVPQYQPPPLAGVPLPLAYAHALRAQPAQPMFFDTDLKVARLGYPVGLSVFPMRMGFFSGPGSSPLAQTIAIPRRMSLKDGQVAHYRRDFMKALNLMIVANDIVQEGLDSNAPLDDQAAYVWFDPVVRQLVKHQYGNEWKEIIAPAHGTILDDFASATLFQEFDASYKKLYGTDKVSAEATFVHALGETAEQGAHVVGHMRYESAAEWQKIFKTGLLTDMLNVYDQPLECADAASSDNLFDTYGLEVYYMGTRDLVSVLLFMKGRAYLRTVTYKSTEYYTTVGTPPKLNVVNPYRTEETPRDCILPWESDGRTGFDILEPQTATDYAARMARGSINPDPVNDLVDPMNWQHNELSQLQQMRVRHLVLHYDKPPVTSQEGIILESSMAEPMKQFAQCLCDRGRVQARLILKTANAILKALHDARTITLPADRSVDQLYFNLMDVQYFPLVRKITRDAMDRSTREDWSVVSSL